jgi:hypothetical protein
MPNGERITEINHDLFLIIRWSWSYVNWYRFRFASRDYYAWGRLRGGPRLTSFCRAQQLNSGIMTGDIYAGGSSLHLHPGWDFNLHYLQEKFPPHFRFFIKTQLDPTHYDLLWCSSIFSSWSDQKFRRSNWLQTNKFRLSLHTCQF